MTKSTQANLLLFFIAALAILSNRHPPWREGIEYLQADDVGASYEVITQSAPDLPSKTLARHHAERFLIPYAIGAAAKVSGISYPLLYRLITYLFMGAILFLLIKALLFLGVSREELWIYVSLVLFNPYAFRYYFIVPGMVTDLAFAFFSLLIFYSLLADRFLLLLLSLGLGILSRQTVLAQLPVILIWIMTDRRQALAPRLTRVVGVIIATGLICSFMKVVAEKFAGPNYNLLHLTGLLTYLQKGAGAILPVMELVVRVLLPVGFVLALFGALVWRQKKLPNDLRFYWLSLGAAAVIAQPILAGPDISGKNSGRLSALGLLPAILALVIISKGKIRFDRNSKLIGTAILFVSSFHHLYTWPSLGGPQEFLVLQLFCMLAMMFLSIKSDLVLKNF